MVTVASSPPLATNAAPWVPSWQVTQTAAVSGRDVFCLPILLDGFEEVAFGRGHVAAGAGAVLAGAGRVRGPDPVVLEVGDVGVPRVVVPVAVVEFKAGLPVERPAGRQVVGVDEALVGEVGGIELDALAGLQARVAGQAHSRARRVGVGDRRPVREGEREGAGFAKPAGVVGVAPPAVQELVLPNATVAPSAPWRAHPCR